MCVMFIWSSICKNILSSSLIKKMKLLVCMYGLQIHYRIVMGFMAAKFVQPTLYLRVLQDIKNILSEKVGGIQDLKAMVV